MAPGTILMTEIRLKGTKTHAVSIWKYLWHVEPVRLRTWFMHATPPLFMAFEKNG